MAARDRDELKRLRIENQRLKKKLEKSEAAVEILGKMPRSWMLWPGARQRQILTWTNRNRAVQSG
jgi:hypothetical protein